MAGQVVESVVHASPRVIGRVTDGTCGGSNMLAGPCTGIPSLRRSPESIKDYSKIAVHFNDLPVRIDFEGPHTKLS
eukprot:3326639-Amphidinium_carterae.1